MKPEVEALAAVKKELAENGVAYMVEAMIALGAEPSAEDIEKMTKGSVPQRHLEKIKRILGDPETPAFIREHFNVVLK